MKNILRQVFSLKNIAISIAIYCFTIGFIFTIKVYAVGEYNAFVSQATLHYMERADDFTYALLPAFSIFAYILLQELEINYISFKLKQDTWDIINLLLISLVLGISLFQHGRYSRMMNDSPHIDEQISCKIKNSNLIECGEYGFIFQNTVEFRASTRVDVVGNI